MIFASVKTALCVAKDWTIQHSPEILLGTSIAAGIGATVTGCIAMTKMEKINEKHKEVLDILNKEYPGRNDGESSDDNREYRRMVTKEYGRYWIDIAKAWAPCVGLTLASGTAALGSFKIINKRLIIAETAFAGVSQAFEKYRDNVIEDQGEEKDLYYATNGALKKKQELIAKGKYKEREPKALSEVPGITTDSRDGIFHYHFNKDTVKWTCYSDAPFYNIRLLDTAASIFNRQLKENGVVLLDEVYTYLGLDLSEIYAEKAAGRTYGWTLDGYAEDGMYNDNQILFGIYEYNDTQHRLFRNGDINDVTLHFNCRLLTKETCELLAKG